MRRKVLIIKLGHSETLDAEISRKSSLGDVLRTTVILHVLKNDDVAWLVDESAFSLLEGNPYLGRILVYDIATTIQLQEETFDTVINFEKVPGICALADKVDAWKNLVLGLIAKQVALKLMMGPKTCYPCVLMWMKRRVAISIGRKLCWG